MTIRLRKMMSFEDEKPKAISCICCWYDFLGFAGPLIKDSWVLSADPNDSITRMKLAKDCFSGPFSRTDSVTLFMNDGAVRNYDFCSHDERSVEKLLGFFDGLFADFEYLNEVDIGNGYPGVRGVLTWGTRWNYCSSDLTELIGSRESGSAIVGYHPREFQMNTAFSKAYIVDDAGSSAGIKGAYLYVDRDLFGYLDAAPYELRTIEVDDELEVKVIKNGEVEAALYFSLPGVKFEMAGLNTTFYRYLKKHTRIDDLVEASSYAEMQRIAALNE